jgi:cell division protein FtsQ
MRLPLPPRPPLRATAGFAAVIFVLALGWLWLRDSSLVAVERVTVTGASGPDAPRVRSALERAARDMTTLHVRHGALRSAVGPFAAVEGVSTSIDFPDVLRIEVHERTPVAALVAGSGRVAVAADGMLLRTTRSADLPEIAAKAAPAGERARGAAVERSIAVLAAGSPALRARVQRIYVGEHGVTLPLRDGPDVYFGSSRRLRAKWAALAVVLADRSSRGASYIDVRLPERPAAGGLEEIAADDDPNTSKPTPVQPQAEDTAPAQPAPAQTTPTTTAPVQTAPPQAAPQPDAAAPAGPTP